MPRVTPWLDDAIQRGRVARMRKRMMQQHEDIVRQQDDAIVRRLACPACAQDHTSDAIHTRYEGGRAFIITGGDNRLYGALFLELVGWIVQAEADLKKVVVHRPNGNFFTHKDQLLAAVESLGYSTVCKEDHWP